MKRIIFICLLAVVLCGCQRLPMPGVSALPQDSKVPYINPNVADASAGTSAPATTAPAPTNTPAIQPSITEKGMMKDIELLIERLGGQTIEESNYKSQKKENMLMVERVSDTELKFAGKQQVFKGDYTGRFTPGKQYKYYPDASMGGKRYYNVKDNFGVWIIFQYSEPIS